MNEGVPKTDFSYGSRVGRPVFQDFSDYVKGFGFAFAVLNHAKKFR
jgi:hypothetical protein